MLYDYQTKRQKLLQGHCNAIKSISATKDVRWFCTVDSGPESVILVWENIACRPENANSSDEGILAAFPIKNIYHSHHGFGAMASEFTTDSKYLITLGAGNDH